MKKLLVILISSVLLTGCVKSPLSSSKEGKDFIVEFLFEKDGIKVYRFYDTGKFHYFTSKGETISTQKEDKHSYDETIN
jgi:hypothetical protein